MARRAVVGLVSLAVGIATLGCAAVGPRRWNPPPQYDAPPPASPQPPTSTVPLPPIAPRAVAPTEQPAPSAIKQVSVPPAADMPIAVVAPTAQPTNGKTPLQLYQRAVETYAGIDSYTARMRRREQVGGKSMPEELIMAQFRKKPFSVHFKWIAGDAKGRELIYVQGQYEGKIHTLLAPTDPRLFSKVMALAPDNPLVTSRSRYPITDAGLGPLIGRFGQLLAQAEKPAPTLSVKSMGLVKRPEYDTMLEGVETVFGPRIDPLVPDGGRRWFFFDPQNGLPVLVVATDSGGHEVEYYCYDRLLYPVKLDDHDFDPRQLSKEK